MSRVDKHKKTLFKKLKVRKKQVKTIDSTEAFKHKKLIHGF